MERKLDYSSLFKGAAAYYAKYRRPYPQEWLRDIVEYFSLDGEGTFLDLGCGTGELTVPLAAHFEKTIGVDPSNEMIEEAKKRAAEKKIEWVENKAEDFLREFDRTLRLTTAGVSLQWMNKAFVLEEIYAHTVRSGGMAIIGDASPVRGKDKTEPWKIRRQEIIEKYLGPVRRAGDALHTDFIPVRTTFTEDIANSPFKTFEVKSYTYKTERTLDEIVGFIYSTSYAAKRLFGNQAEEFEKELRQELLTLVPSGVFVEEGKAEIFFLTK